MFPSNNLELAIWMESERLMHPVINQIGVDTQNEVVKEEKDYVLITNLMEIFSKQLNKICLKYILIDGLLLAKWNI